MRIPLNVKIYNHFFGQSHKIIHQSVSPILACIEIHAIKTYIPVYLIITV